VSRSVAGSRFTRSRAETSRQDAKSAKSPLKSCDDADNSDIREHNLKEIRTVKRWLKSRHDAVAYEQANAALRQSLPGLEDAVVRAYDYAKSEAPGPHTLYDEALNPTRRLLRKAQQ
jgi:hypothetical protein